MTQVPTVASSPAYGGAAEDGEAFQSLADALPTIIWTAGADGKPDYWNRRWFDETGLTPEEAGGWGWVVAVHSEDVQRALEQWKGAVGRLESFEVECRLRTGSERSYRWYVVRGAPVRNAAGAITRWCGTFTDIDEGRRKGEEMLNVERFLDSIVENIPDMIFVKDAHELRFVRVNRAEEEMVGLPRQELIGKNDGDLFPKEEAEFFNKNDRIVLNSGQLLDIPEEMIHTNVGLRLLHTKKIPILDQSGKPQYLLGISRDITERKRAEEQLVEKNRLLQEAARSEREAHDKLKLAQSQLVQSEKLAGLGQLVAGVAHEINNPLAFVTNNVVVLQRDMPHLVEVLRLYQGSEQGLAATDPATLARIHELAERMDLEYVLENLADTLARSRDGLKRIQQIVKDLREFSRQEAIGDVQEGVDLNPGIQSTINIVRGRAKHQNVEIELDLSPLPGIACYPAKMNQVVMNLLANAIDACHDGGKVTVRSRAVAGGVELEVSDTGCGINATLLEKIFDPFFTTKPVGKGTGLGLSISHGIVAEHGGTIKVESAAGKGTCFTVRLPLVLPSDLKAASQR